jgi:hypothetical protein
MVASTYLPQIQQETYLSQVFVSVNTQVKACPTQANIDVFLADLTTDEKAIGLTQVAQDQASKHYIFMYPVAEYAQPATKCNAANGNPGYWDSVTFLQSNGQPFINLIESLMTQYNQVQGTVQLVTTSTLSKQPDGSYVAALTTTNSGSGTVNGIVLTSATLGSATGTPVPQNLGSIIPGGYSTGTVTFPASAGTSGSAVVGRFNGTYNGGTFGASIRETLP